MQTINFECAVQCYIWEYLNIMSTQEIPALLVFQLQNTPVAKQCVIAAAHNNNCICMECGKQMLFCTNTQLRLINHFEGKGMVLKIIDKINIAAREEDRLKHTSALKATYIIENSIPTEEVKAMIPDILILLPLPEEGKPFSTNYSGNADINVTMQNLLCAQRFCLAITEVEDLYIIFNRLKLTCSCLSTDLPDTSSAVIATNNPSEARVVMLVPTTQQNSKSTVRKEHSNTEFILCTYTRITHTILKTRILISPVRLSTAAIDTIYNRFNEIIKGWNYIFCAMIGIAIKTYCIYYFEGDRQYTEKHNTESFHQGVIFESSDDDKPKRPTKPKRKKRNAKQIPLSIDINSWRHVPTYSESDSEEFSPRKLVPSEDKASSSILISRRPVVLKKSLLSALPVVENVQPSTSMEQDAENVKNVSVVRKAEDQGETESSPKKRLKEIINLHQSGNFKLDNAVLP